MRRIINNLLYSKAPLMLIMRYILVGLIMVMGIARLRILFSYLHLSHTYTNRDILVEYLMAKALINGINPYLPLQELVHRFVGAFAYYPHPSPYPPFVAIMSIPLLLVNVENLVVTWLVFELLLIFVIAGILTVFWKGHFDWIRAFILFFFMIAWNYVMVELYFGQLSILVTALLLAAFIAIRKEKKYLAGVLIGLTVAIKLITWPFIIYFALKKDMKGFIVSSITAVVLNLFAWAIVGLNPFLDYIFRGSRQVISFWFTSWYNYSLWSIGSRIFVGTEMKIFGGIHAPPIIASSRAAFLLSIVIVGIFLVYGMYRAVRSRNVDTAFAILVCITVAVSPLSWDHYYIMLIIPIAILIRTLAKKSFPNYRTFIFLILIAMLFLLNGYIINLIEGLNGGKEILQANGYQVSFISSLLDWLPIVELVGLTLLLWRSDKNILCLEESSKINSKPSGGGSRNNVSLLTQVNDGPYINLPPA